VIFARAASASSCDLFLGDKTRQPLADPLAPLGGGIQIDIGEQDRQPRLRHDLRNARAHLPGTDNGNSFHAFTLSFATGRGHAGPQTENQARLVKPDQSRAAGARNPERIGALVERARQHEAVIGKPVEIGQRRRIDRLGRRQCHAGPLGPAHDGTRQMNPRRRLAATGQNEAGERGRSALCASIACSSQST
jgi:hypothetical protein